MTNAANVVDRAQMILDSWDQAWVDLSAVVGGDVNSMRDVIRGLLDERETLLVGVECVLLDHAAELSGPDVDANLADLAYCYLAAAGDTADDEIRAAVDATEAAAATCPRG